jgi:hypothetical protein
MEGDREYTVDEIEFAAAAILDAPGGVHEDALIDELYLGAVAACLMGHYLPSASKWTEANQDAVLLAKARGDRTFSEVIDYVAGDMLRTSWLDRFFYGVSPKEPDPKTIYLRHIGALEELSMSAIIDVRFAVQTFCDTIPKKRWRLLAGLAETSRCERIAECEEQ